MRKLSLVSWIGHRIRELTVYTRFLARANRRPVICISISDSKSGFSSDLRGRWIVGHWRKSGVNALVLPSQLERNQRNRINSLIKPDIVVHQKFRHDDNDPDLYPKATNIIDLDDADFLDPRMIERMKERVTKCQGGIGGSRYTANWLEMYVPVTTVVWTGSPYANVDFPLPSGRSNKKVVWATTSPLSDVEDAEFIRRVLELLSVTQSFELVVIGDANGERLKNFFSKALERKMTLHHYPYLPYDEFIEQLKQTSVGLAPLITCGSSFNNGKSFGKILGYISAGVPVVASDSADHSLFFVHGENGFVSNDEKVWCNCISELLESSSRRDEVAINAKRSLKEKLSINVSSKKTLEFVLAVHENNIL